MCSLPSRSSSGYFSSRNVATPSIHPLKSENQLLLVSARATISCSSVSRLYDYSCTSENEAAAFTLDVWEAFSAERECARHPTAGLSSGGFASGGNERAMNRGKVYAHGKRTRRWLANLLQTCFSVATPAAANGFKPPLRNCSPPHSMVSSISCLRNDFNDVIGKW